MDFFRSDVPEHYQDFIVKRLLLHFSEKNVSVVRDDLDHYGFMMTAVVYKKMDDILGLFNQTPHERKLELLEELFKEYALI